MAIDGTTACQCVKSRKDKMRLRGKLRYVTWFRTWNKPASGNCTADFGQIMHMYHKKTQPPNDVDISWKIYNSFKKIKWWLAKYVAENVYLKVRHSSHSFMLEMIYALKHFLTQNETIIRIWIRIFRWKNCVLQSTYSNEDLNV